MKIIDFTQVLKDDAYANVGAYIADLMAAIRAVCSFSTVEKLINRVLSIIPRDCPRIDLVTDCYREVSSKNSTRSIRGEVSFTILKSTNTKTRDTNAFLHENENRSQLIKLFFDWLVDSRKKTLNTLRTTRLYLSTEGYYRGLLISNVSFIDSLV